MEINFLFLAEISPYSFSIPVLLVLEYFSNAIFFNSPLSFGNLE